MWSPLAAKTWAHWLRLLELALHLCWLKLPPEEWNFQTKHIDFTLATTQRRIGSTGLTYYFLHLHLTFKASFKSINSKVVRRGQKWLEVVSDPTEQNYNYLVSIWSCGLQCQEWTSCCLLSELGQTQLSFSNEVKGVGLAPLNLQLGHCSFQWFPCRPNNSGPTALAAIYHHLSWLFYCLLWVVLMQLFPHFRSMFKCCEQKHHSTC